MPIPKLIQVATDGTDIVLFYTDVSITHTDTHTHTHARIHRFLLVKARIFIKTSSKYSMESSEWPSQKQGHNEPSFHGHPSSAGFKAC